MRGPVFNTETFPTAPRTVPGKVISGAGTHYSGIWDIDGAPGFGLYFETSGTLTGTWTLWRTSMPDPVLTDDTDWDDEVSFTASADYTNPAGAGTKWATEVNGARNALWRAKFVNTSGNGSLFLDVNAQRG